MSSEAAQTIAVDGEDIVLERNGQRWLIAWHPPAEVPPGRPHGSVGLCVADSGGIVLVSADGTRWDLPGGRPEGTETWEQTLRREMHEEACATVRTVRLLGFSRGRCVRGDEEGLVLVRAFWRADVELQAWTPLFEIAHRKLVAPTALLGELTIEHGYLPVYRRALRESGFVD